MPQDDSQPECAISGERFDVAWDAAREAHVYVGARRLHGADAEQHGVRDGAIVKVCCAYMCSLLPFLSSVHTPARSVHLTCENSCAPSAGLNRLCNQHVNHMTTLAAAAC